ncbi:MAG: hypothetical protein IPO21_12585 [Bacteroidales bacterium]|nr:hypothetical protein [Bacteroidales bacterium]
MNTVQAPAVSLYENVPTALVCEKMTNLKNPVCGLSKATVDEPVHTSIGGNVAPANSFVVPPTT